MKRTWPFIRVKDVKASAAWYQSLLACRSPHDPAHPHREHFDQIADADGAVLLSLIKWSDGELAEAAARGPVGAGVSFYFAVDDFDAAWERVQALRPTVLEKPHLLTWGFQTREFTVCDPDGYRLTLGDRTQGWIATSGLL